MTDEDLTDLASQLGYHWPDDPECQWQVLRLMAETAAHWRAEVSKCQAETWPELEKDRLIAHYQKMIKAQRLKIANLRWALRNYMAAQAAFVREESAALQRARIEQRK